MQFTAENMPLIGIRGGLRKLERLSLQRDVFPQQSLELQAGNGAGTQAG